VVEKCGRWQTVLVVKALPASLPRKLEDRLSEHCYFFLGKRTDLGQEIKQASVAEIQSRIDKGQVIFDAEAGNLRGTPPFNLSDFLKLIARF
jgi:hypothetical protein